MSSKLIRGPGAEGAEPILWRRLQPGQSQTAEAVSQEELRALQVRLAELEREIPRREQQAFEAGYRKGAAEGHQQAAAQLRPVLEGFAAGVQELRQLRGRMRREAERDVVRLSVAIARRILHRELTVDPAALLGIVKAALERLEAQEVDRLRVHPSDAELLRQHLAEAGLAERIQLVADARLGRGAAVLETSHGALDASLETQLEEIQRGLLDRLHRAS